jgi:hypothetical protein
MNLTHECATQHNGHGDGDHGTAQATQGLTFDITKDGKTRRSLVCVIDQASGTTIHHDRLDLARTRAREDFIKDLLKRLDLPKDGIAEKRAALLKGLEAQANKILEEDLAAPGSPAGGSEGSSGAATPPDLPYVESDGATYRVVGLFGPPQHQLLANFTARIAREIHRIEIGQASLAYQITATHQDGSVATVVVSAEKFARMEWLEALGAKYVVTAGRGVRDDLRCAIPSLTERDGAIPGT